ncbi:hypothetical protein B0H10DRAFT_321069 [Mycena sp. CBHHK59/15]|nr:hypothetical protein B0H10DRAFT_321069 [Mycena sp. CBHHK59/15]
MPNTFPQELIDVVVDELHADMASLAACALSFRTMVASAQMHLFYKVTLAPPPAASKGGLKKASQCQRLAKILSSSPHLIPLIKDLRIIDDDPNSESWMVNSARSLSTILPLLTLKRISIRCALGSVDWDHMPRALKAPLQNIFKSPGLQSIQLHGIFLTEPRSSPLYLIFGDASDLRELSFSYETRKRVNPNVGPSDWQPKLTSLAITSNNTEDLILTLLNPKIYFSCLRTLCLASLLDPEINQLLTAIQDRSAIESLTIFYSHDWVFTSGLSALRSMKSLRSLRICTNTIRDGMVAVIRDDCAPNVSLEHITIEIRRMFYSIGWACGVAGNGRTRDV